MTHQQRIPSNSHADACLHPCIKTILTCTIITMASAGAAGLSPLGKAFFGSLCAGTFGLGCWQTQRFFDKQELVAKREEDLALEPQPLDEADSAGMRRKVVEGTYLHGREVLVGLRGPPPGAMASSGPGSGRSQGGMSSSPQGYFVITPLLRPNGSTVLINRGWIPRHFAPSSTQPGKDWEHPAGEVQVVGVPFRYEREYGSVCL